MSVVTDQTRGDVWNNLLDAEKNFRYFGAIADRYSTRHKLLRFGLLVSLLIEATVLIPNTLAHDSLVLTAVGGIVIVVLGAWDAVSDYGKTAAGLRLVNADCDLLRNEWAELWRDIETYAIDESQARVRLRELENRQSVIVGRSDVELNESINDSSEEEAFKVVVGEQYAAS